MGSYGVLEGVQRDTREINARLEAKGTQELEKMNAINAPVSTRTLSF